MAKPGFWIGLFLLGFGSLPSLVNRHSAGECDLCQHTVNTDLRSRCSHLTSCLTSRLWHCAGRQVTIAGLCRRPNYPRLIPSQDPRLRDQDQGVCQSVRDKIKTETSEATSLIFTHRCKNTFLRSFYK